MYKINLCYGIISIWHNVIPRSNIFEVSFNFGYIYNIMLVILLATMIYLYFLHKNMDMDKLLNKSIFGIHTNQLRKNSFLIFSANCYFALCEYQLMWLCKYVNIVHLYAKTMQWDYKCVYIPHISSKFTFQHKFFNHTGKYI